MGDKLGAIMVSLFSGNTVDDVWPQILSAAMSSDSHEVNSRAGAVREILHAIITINNPKERWTSTRFPPMSIGYALAELIWILKGSDDASIINYWNPALPKMSGNYKRYPGAYGYRIASNYGFNQLVKSCTVLKNNPNTRQSVMMIWDPHKDTPSDDGQPANGDIPCNICSFLKIRDGNLEWTQIMRSNDILLGFPYNMIQFTSMHEILAGWLGVGMGSYTHFSDSLHLYDKDLSRSSATSASILANTDSLSIDINEFPRVIDLIFDFMKGVSTAQLNEDALLALLNCSADIPEGYRNMLYIIAVYAADRMGLYPVSQEILSKCSNKLYTHLWLEWKSYRKSLSV